MEPKENKCKIKFQCNSYDCVYFKKDTYSNCDYEFKNKCTSKLAQANAMFLKMKEMGIDLKKGNNHD